MSNFFETLKSVLLQCERLAAQDGSLLRNYALELGNKMDEEVLTLLFDNAETQKLFFTKVKKFYVFDKQKFAWVVNNRQFLPDSYTRFCNKIGLVDKREHFIASNGNVVLSFPYKDCVLEGGQTKDDQKRDELMWNELLSPDEVDRLLAPKVFCNVKRYTVNGNEPITELTDTDNLIIKGNNLFVIASLLKRYAGKVKCIYIDPPYNTGNDSFGYNDSFLRSSWLTFMRNRLEVAYRLLSDDGFLFVQCDDYQSAYLKVLLDSIFGEENYRNSIYWHRTYAGKTVSKKLPWNTDTILFYSKKQETQLYPTTASLSFDDIAGYNKDDGDGRGKYNTVSLQKTGGPGPETTYDYIDNNGKVWVCPVKGWRMKQSKLRALENDNRLYITDTTIREKYYLSERQEIGKQIDNFWSDIGNMNRVSDALYDLDGQKPEQLIERFIRLSTIAGDIVLDFFAGTGTTCAVACKLGRHFIGVEQMDYIHTKMIKRLCEVIAGEQGGISKSVNWQGGGSFVYCELAQLNAKTIEEIQSADDDETLHKIWKSILRSGYYNCKVDIDETAANFDELPLADKKQFLFAVLDKNMLYVNYNDINDFEFNISDEDKEFTKRFYGK
ncbi:MAG: site-specific DNA-methyltransferase [Planctomycetaceae bacterium]|jgi:adenine-specific DNA-methyltransferase|nr:site-specific DNA-methyltransferase [Planctomycetaceae bacterium]